MRATIKDYKRALENVLRVRSLSSSDIDRMLMAIANGYPVAFNFGVDMVIPSHSGTITDAWREKCLALIKEDKKINAIKLCREATGLGLKEVKEIIDQMASEIGM